MPTFSLTVIANTYGDEGVFNFELATLADQVATTLENFNLETVDRTIHRTFSDLPAEQVYHLLTTDQPDWIFSNGSCFGQGSFTFSPLPYGMDITPQAGAEISCYFNFTHLAPEQEPTGKRPVLIVPGILGTGMFKGLEELWANPKMANPLNPDTFMDPLQFTLTLQASDPSVYFGDIIRQRAFFNYSQGLIDIFTSQGYTENTNLFTFPYDWRYGLTGTYPDGSTNAVRLRLKIQEILNKTHFKKIDIVAHSMGGAIVKQYVTDHPSNHSINKAVLVGVPNLGSVSAIKMLTQGDNLHIYGLSDAEMKKIAENMPGVYDLLPSQSFYDAFGSFIRVLAPSNLGVQVITDLDYNQTRSFLLSDHGLNAAAYNNAQALHSSSFDAYDMRTSGVSVYTLTGCKSGTLGAYQENRLEGTTLASTSYSPEVVSGDGTVSYDSANTIPADDDKRLYAIKPDHGKMPSQEGIRQEIVNIIAGSSLPTGNKIITRQQLIANPNLCKINGKGIKILSPVNIEVVDGLGNRLGLAPDGSLQNDIPGADFEVDGDHKFVFLPQGDSEIYSINLTGTDTGTFTIQDQNIINGILGDTQVFPSLPVTQNLKGKLDISSADSRLKLDNDGDGTIDQTLAPSAILDTDQSQDFIAPTTTASLTGDQGQPEYYRSDVKITFNAVDPVISGHESETSGIFRTEYSLDGGAWLICDSSAPVSVVAEGSHTLSFYSIDKAGNAEFAQTLTFVIDITPPVISVSSPLSKDYARSETLSIIADIKDAETGVATSTIQLDGQAVNNNDSIDLFFHPLGNHQVEVVASDFVGNTATSTVNFRVIATVDSAIADIERSYALGWITSKSVKNSLINKLKSVVKLEKRIDEITIKISGKSKVIKRVERFEKTINKALLRLFLTEARFYRHKSLNDQAYNILTEDINWLLNN